MQNPAPGGGAGTTFTESVQPNSITLTATGPDGINTGFGEIDFSVAMSAAVTGSVQTAVNWSVAGAGSISSAGVYTPPAAVPANPAVTIQAALASNPAITASYALTLVNPLPVLSSANPTRPVLGGTVSMVLTGTGFVPGTVLTASAGTITTTYNSPTSITAQVTLPASASGNLSLTPQNSTPGGGTGAALVLPIAALTMTATNPDGTANNGTAQLGVQVNFITSIVNGAVSSRVWTLQGAGTLTRNGHATIIRMQPTCRPRRCRQTQA